MRGRFEAHLTVEAATEERRLAFAALCRLLGVKCVLIELAAGVHRAQPMTSSHHAGELAQVEQEVAILRAHLVTAGFVVTRTKLEAEVTNEGVPVLEPGPPGTYFEFHAKLAVGDDEAVRALCLAHGAHLSANAIERGARFATMRVYEVGRDEAHRRFAQLLAALVPHEIISTKAEYTVHDSRIELDAGWLP